MDLALTQSQEMLRAAAREFVDREYSKDTLLQLESGDIELVRSLWQKTANAGWPGILVPSEYGGEGGSLTDAAVFLEELGRGPAPGTFFGTAILGVLAIMEAGSNEQQASILPKIASGETRIALAATESRYGWRKELTQTQAKVSDGGYLLNGQKLFVQDAAHAGLLLCTALLDDGEVALFIVDSSLPGVAVRRLPGFLSNSYEVALRDVEVPVSALMPGGWDGLDRALLKALPVLAAYQVGACEQVFDMTLDYANTRVQFGLPIGRFQRVQDHVIQIVNLKDAARWTTYEALWKLDEGKPDAATAVHVSKAVTNEAYYLSCNAAHEVHAGLGIMREYGLTLHTRMSRTLYHYLGDPAHHKARLASELGL